MPTLPPHKNCIPESRLQKAARCQIPLPAISISPAPAIFAISAAMPRKDGRTVRWRQIFRSNHLGHLTDEDVAVLRTLGVKSAFDFRGTEERTEALCGMTEHHRAFAAGRTDGGRGAARDRSQRDAAVDGRMPSR